MTKQEQTKLTCTERDNLLLDTKTRLPAERWTVYASLSDIGGRFGEPRVSTTWGYEAFRIEDVRHPNITIGGEDVKPCEHYSWIEKEAQE